MRPNLWMYFDEITMNSTAVSLTIFSAEILKRGKLIKDLHQLKELIEKIHTPAYAPSDEVQQEISEFGLEYLTDCIRIVVFFENYMKAVLINKGFCVHSIKKDYDGFELLRKEQFKRPITLKEISDIQQFQVLQNEKEIYHNALSEMTIGVKDLIKSPDYLQHYQFEQSLLAFLKDLNLIRNKLHLNHELVFSISKQFIENIEKVNEFVDKTIASIVQSTTQ